MKNKLVENLKQRLSEIKTKYPDGGNINKNKRGFLEEKQFRKEYEKYSELTDNSPNPYDIEHFYDYSKLFDETGGILPHLSNDNHLPSEYKELGHPNLFINGINTKKFQDGGSLPKPNQATRQDSLDVFKSALQSKAFYDKLKPYYEKPRYERFGWTNEEISEVENQTILNNDTSDRQRAIIKNNRNPNVNYINDLITGALDPNAPLIRYDQRIEPQGQVSYTPKTPLYSFLKKYNLQPYGYYDGSDIPNQSVVIDEKLAKHVKNLEYYQYLVKNNEPVNSSIMINASKDLQESFKYFKSKNVNLEELKKAAVDNYLVQKNLPGYQTVIPYYDPLAVKPFDMLTDKEKELRYKKYGDKGFPKNWKPTVNNSSNTNNINSNNNNNNTNNNTNNVSANNSNTNLIEKIKSSLTKESFNELPMIPTPNLSTVIKPELKTTPKQKAFVQQTQATPYRPMNYQINLGNKTGWKDVSETDLDLYDLEYPDGTPFKKPEFKFGGRIKYPDGGRIYANKQGVIMGPVENPDSTYTLPQNQRGEPVVNFPEVEITPDSSRPTYASPGRYAKDLFKGVTEPALDLLFPNQEYTPTINERTGLPYEASGRADATELPIEIGSGILRKPLKKGSEKFGEYLTTKTPLKNARKLNPFAENLNNPNKSYRVAGEDAYQDFLNTGVVQSADGKLSGLRDVLPDGRVIQIKRPTGFPSFQKGYADLTYADPAMKNFIYETSVPTFKRGEINPVTGVKIKGRHYAHRPIDMNTGEVITQLPAKDVRVFESTPHWLKGYKEISKQKFKYGGNINNTMKKKKYNLGTTNPIQPFQVPSNVDFDYTDLEGLGNTNSILTNDSFNQPRSNMANAILSETDPVNKPINMTKVGSNLGPKGMAVGAALDINAQLSDIMTNHINRKDPAEFNNQWNNKGLRKYAKYLGPGAGLIANQVSRGKALNEFNENKLNERLASTQNQMYNQNASNINFSGDIYAEMGAHIPASNINSLKGPSHRDGGIELTDFAEAQGEEEQIVNDDGSSDIMSNEHGPEIELFHDIPVSKESFAEKTSKLKKLEEKRPWDKITKKYTDAMKDKYKQLQALQNKLREIKKNKTSMVKEYADGGNIAAGLGALSNVLGTFSKAQLFNQTHQEPRTFTDPRLIDIEPEMIDFNIGANQEIARGLYNMNQVSDPSRTGNIRAGMIKASIGKGRGLSNLRFKGDQANAAIMAQNDTLNAARKNQLAVEREQDFGTRQGLKAQLINEGVSNAVGISRNYQQDMYNNDMLNYFLYGLEPPEITNADGTKSPNLKRQKLAQNFSSRFRNAYV
jgi:hypothetical protein